MTPTESVALGRHLDGPCDATPNRFPIAYSIANQMNQSVDDGPVVAAEYDPETDTYRAHFDPDAPGSLSGAVVYLVSVATGENPLSMDPLNDVVDPDALETLFWPDGGAVRVKFEFCGCDVTAMSEGEVRVESPDERLDV